MNSVPGPTAKFGLSAACARGVQKEVAVAIYTLHTDHTRYEQVAVAIYTLHTDHTRYEQVAIQLEQTIPFQATLFPFVVVTVQLIQFCNIFPKSISAAWVLV